ncbi:FFAR3 protein, partial [Nothoprocta pentlandii]|nr:FFAR3 protein [Nothoprocta pentlandii]
VAEAATVDRRWPLPAALCPVANFCFYSSIYLSSLFLAALSVERYLSVAFPLRSKCRRRPGLYAAASCVLWLVATSHCSVVFVAAFGEATNGSVETNGPSGGGRDVGGQGFEELQEV